jgi:hypothetical protein
MTDDLADRLDAVEDALADTSPAGSLFTFADPDLPDADPDGAVFHLPREVTDNWGQLDADGRGESG